MYIGRVKVMKVFLKGVRCLGIHLARNTGVSTRWYFTCWLGSACPGSYFASAIILADLRFDHGQVDKWSIFWLPVFLLYSWIYSWRTRFSQQAADGGLFMIRLFFVIEGSHGWIWSENGPIAAGRSTNGKSHLRDQFVFGLTNSDEHQKCDCDTSIRWFEPCQQPLPPQNETKVKVSKSSLPCLLSFQLSTIF